MRTPIVCNTGPLIALSLIDCENILSEIFEPIITQTVFAEWSQGPDYENRTLPKGIELVPSPTPDPLLVLQLDAGEASVIQTAIERGIKVVLIDERKGRKIARRVCGLETLGTAGLLVIAKHRGLIGDLAPMFERLKNHSYWIATPIVDWALDAAGER